MKGIGKKIVLSVGLCGVLSAAAYKIPEQSLDSMALSAANVAHVQGADASYYNPANMIWMDPNKSFFEFALTYIHLPSIDFTSSVNPLLNGSSKKEDFLVPTFFYVSEKYDFLRWGVSLTAPAGLSKKWDDIYQKAYAQEFSLKVLELSPSISFELLENLSFAAGIRFVYSEGKVKSDSTELFQAGIAKGALARDMDGDMSEFGYNFALSYRPSESLTLAATYRSKVDLKEEGRAQLYFAGKKMYDNSANVTVPLPAVITLAASYALEDKKTVLEFTYERTKWGVYRYLDFEYDGELHPGLKKFFDDPIPKFWDDTNTYRFGITHQYNDKLKLMAGFAIDETPVPKETLGFELPDADAKIYSVGFDYKINPKMSVGAAYLYDDKDDVSVNQGPEGINGEFSGGGAHLLTVGFKYTY